MNLLILVVVFAFAMRVIRRDIRVRARKLRNTHQRLTDMIGMHRVAEPDLSRD